MRKQNLLIYANLSGNTSQLIGVIAGSILLPLLDYCIDEPSLARFIMLATLGGLIGHLTARHTHSFFRSGYYYQRLALVDHVFKHIGATLNWDMKMIDARGYNNEFPNKHLQLGYRNL
jgi:hypothetical protein